NNLRHPFILPWSERQMPREGLHLRFSLLRKNVRFQSPHDRSSKRIVPIDSDGQWHPGLSTRECEPGRHDADHGAVNPVESDPFSQNSGVRAESLLPDFVAEYNDAVAARLVLAGQKSAADCRLCA